MVASHFIKPAKIVSAALGVLERELTLPQLVWRNAVGSFAGSLNDTISIRVPAYSVARTRALRSGTTRTRDRLVERKIDVTLDTDVYKDIRITDEELTLDIADFGSQVLNPVMAGIVRALEDAVATEIANATYALTASYDISSGDVYKDVAVAARQKLNAAHVPFTGRTLLVGSDLETAFLTNDRFVHADKSGDQSNSAMHEATIGRVAGFDVVVSPAVDSNMGYAFHKSAFIMSEAAPVVPAGAPYGHSASFNGFALRVVRVLDSATIEDILAVDAWVGTNVVTDNGTVTNGIFTPSEDPDNSGEADLFVRAVKITASA